jgi:hypothetical protein
VWNTAQPGVAGAVPASATRLEDVDGDLNLDLVARFDRPALQALLGQTPDPTVILRATWLFLDDEAGQAWAQVRIIR